MLIVLLCVDVAVEFEQRAPIRKALSRPDGESRLWLSDDESVKPVATDSYVIVDEQDEGVAVVVVTGWPRLDGRGRLKFAGRRRTAAVSVQTLNDVVSRRGNRPEGVQRPVRIGDAFCVRGQVGRLPERWGRIVDVTAQARDRAKVALHAAVAPHATPQQARALKLEKPKPEPEAALVESATVAHPAI